MATKRKYLVVWYDVTGLKQPEIDQLMLEAVVQGEENDGDPADLNYHPSVPVATDEVETTSTEAVSHHPGSFRQRLDSAAKASKERK